MYTLALACYLGLVFVLFTLHRHHEPPVDPEERARQQRERDLRENEQRTHVTGHPFKYQ